jgi:hypothetical protein
MDGTKAIGTNSPYSRRINFDSYWEQSCREFRHRTGRHDPNVWTGGALQEKSVSWVFGLAPMYPAFGWS